MKLRFLFVAPRKQTTRKLSKQSPMLRRSATFRDVKRNPFSGEFGSRAKTRFCRLDFSPQARVESLESGLILERGYPGGRGGYLGHDQLAINIASRQRSPHRDTPFALRNGNRYCREPPLSQIPRPIETSESRRAPRFDFASRLVISARRPCCSTFAASDSERERERERGS